MKDIHSLKFTKSHEWIAPDGTVGISDHAQKEVTDVVFVELPPIGKPVSKEGETATIESVKAAFPIYSPVSGKVTAVNDKAAQDVTLVHKDPFGQGWLFKIDLSNPDETANLLNEDAYNKSTAESAH